MRWQQFETLVLGNAPLPEPGFAWGLYYQVSGDKEYGRKAIEFALSANADLRQQALIFDWCQDLLTEPQTRDLTARLTKGIVEPAGAESIPSVRSRTLARDRAVRSRASGAERAGANRAAVVGGAHDQDPEIRSRHHFRARDAYPLWELMHGLRDSTNIDLRESYPRFFKDFPIEHLMSHYPAIFEGPRE